MNSPSKTSAGRPRPLSPHLQVYRLPLTAITSISHRISGVVLLGGAFLMVGWILALSGGKESFEQVAELLESWLGIVLMAAFNLALFYHLCNGIRHLAWDFGFGFSKESAYRGSILVIVGALVLTFLSMAMVI